MTQTPADPATPTAAPRQGRWSRFFLGLLVAAVPTALVARTELVPDAIGGLVVLAVLVGAAVWHVRSGRLRRDGPAFLVGLVLGVPLLAALFLIVIVGVFTLSSSSV